MPIKLKPSVVHPKLLANLKENFYPATCTIEFPTEVQDTDGSVIVVWANLAEHVAIPCRVAPEQQGGQREVRTETEIFVVHAWHIDLAGYYPLITAKMRAVIVRPDAPKFTPAATYDIEQVQHDGQSETTRLLSQVAE